MLFDPNIDDAELLAEGVELIVHFETFPKPHRGIVQELAKGARKETIVTTLFEDGTVVACTVDKHGSLWETADESHTTLPWRVREVPADDLFLNSMLNADGSKKSIAQLLDEPEEENDSKARGKRPARGAAAQAEEKKKQKMKSALKKLEIPGSVDEAARVRVVDEVLRGRA